MKYDEDNLKYELDRPVEIIDRSGFDVIALVRGGGGRVLRGENVGWKVEIKHSLTMKGKPTPRIFTTFAE